jgi:glycosyltransferase involved in cell wall biosynthesis
MTELVRDGVDGIVVAPRDPEAIAAALAKLASDPELRLSLGEQARERVRTEFSLDRQATSLAEHYRKVIAAHSERDRLS